MRPPDVGRQVVLSQRSLDPPYEVSPISLVIGMLQLASATFREMSAWRFLMMRSRCKGAVLEQRVSRNAERHMPPARGHSVAAGRDPDDQLVHSRRASARGIDAARSSAIICGPAISAARPCSHTAAQAAPKLLSTRDIIAAINPASTSP